MNIYKRGIVQGGLKVEQEMLQKSRRVGKRHRTQSVTAGAEIQMLDKLFDWAGLSSGLT